MTEGWSSGTAVGRSLGRRVVELDRASRRLTAFAPAADPAGPDPTGPDRDATDGALTLDDTRELVLRALHAATGPTTGLMLRAICAQPSTGTGLARVAARPRLATWEDVSDLVQVGLAERDLERDLVRPTPAGRALVELVEELAAAAWAEARP